MEKVKQDAKTLRQSFDEVNGKLSVAYKRQEEFLKVANQIHAILGENYSENAQNLLLHYCEIILKNYHYLQFTESGKFEFCKTFIIDYNFAPDKCNFFSKTLTEELQKIVNEYSPENLKILETFCIQQFLHVKVELV